MSNDGESDNEEESGDDDGRRTKITVEASSVDDIADALDLEREPEEEEDEEDEYPEELLVTLETLGEVYRGVEIATERDERGRSRKMVRRFAELDELTSDSVGHHLRVLEEHDLVVRDGNRWRLPEGEDGD